MCGPNPHFDEGPDGQIDYVQCRIDLIDDVGRRAEFLNLVPDPTCANGNTRRAKFLRRGAYRVTHGDVKIADSVIQIVECH